MLTFLKTLKVLKLLLKGQSEKFITVNFTVTYLSHRMQREELSWLIKSFVVDAVINIYEYCIDS